MLAYDLPFGSLWVYCPHGKTEEAITAKNIMFNLKNERTFEGIPKKSMSELIAEIISKRIENLPFKDFFGPHVSLVPVPKSSLMVSGALWVPERICIELSKKELGNTYPCLERFKPLIKSSTSKAIDRPMVIDHYNSIQVKSFVQRPQKMVLIDDVVTRGATLIGCASRLKEKFPGVPIFAFAVMRTITEAGEFKNYQSPCIGKIELYNSGKTHRSP